MLEGQMGMTKASSKTEPGEQGRNLNPRHVHRLVEWIAVVVLVVALWWLLQNHPPRGPISTALLDRSLWLLVLLVSGLGAAGSLISYYAGRRGTEAVFEHYPKLEGRQWERLEAAYQKWGAPTLALSGIPYLGVALLVAAGAFGIKVGVFLFWAFVGKVLRNWAVALAVLFGFGLLV
jgi:membrane protein YqaA with SNARE-associated domain